MPDIGNSNRISRGYIDSLYIETRYMDSTNPDTAFTLYGNVINLRGKGRRQQRNNK